VANASVRAESPAVLERAIRQSTNGIVITDPNLPDDPIVYANPAFERMTGYALDEILGRNCRFLQRHDRDQPALEELRGALREGRASRVTLRNYKKDGELFFNELYVSPVVDGEGRLVNFVGVQNDVTERVRDEEARDMLLLGEQAAREEAEASRARLALLARAGMVLSTSLQYEMTVSHVARLVVPAFADFCMIDALDEDGNYRQIAAAHADSRGEELLHRLGERRRLTPEQFKRTNRLAAGILKNAEPLVLTEIPERLLVENADDEEHLALWQALNPRSAIIVPLKVRGRAFGTISFVSSTRDRRYGGGDLEFAEDLAHRCALAIDNARLYRERSEIARTLQGSLLPRSLPRVEGLEVGLRYLPAGDGRVEVGGDFYDLFDAHVDGQEPGASYGAVIGDVCGKGTGAAAVLALARHTIRAVATRVAGPAEVLAGLNEAMLREMRESGDHKFCTVAYARVSPQPDGSVRARVSLGGHPPALLLRADGALRRVGHPGRAIGVFEEANLAEQEAVLRPGDALVFYTDGVTEARVPGRGAFFGEERLNALLRACARERLDADALAGRIEETVLHFQENDPHDDVAVLVLRVPEAGS
jgi:PAS domain S-box-containing protein